jgi:hypothetical protein
MTSKLSFRKRFTSNQPADSWETGLLIGNGIMGASVYGTGSLYLTLRGFSWKSD